jgi:hypothetical protein
MGGKLSKRKTKEQAEAKTQQNEELITGKKQFLLKLKNQIKSRPNLLENKDSTNSDLILRKNTEMSFERLIDISLCQLDRKGKNLIKDDLIAIIISLNPKSALEIIELQQSSVPDLCTLIRSIIYDPIYLEKRWNQSLTKHNVTKPNYELIEK